MKSIVDLTEDEVRSIFFEDRVEDFEYEEVDVTEWTVYRKYEFCEKIIKTKDGTHYAIPATRSGSYFTDYEYNDFPEGKDLKIVEKVPFVTYKWKEI